MLILVVWCDIANLCEEKMESGKNERDGELNRREFNELEYERGELSGLN